MVSDAGRAAALRCRSTAHRVVELQRRIDRLRAGEAPTPNDVDRARASAEAQRLESELARQRLAETRAAAAERRRQAAAKRRRQAAALSSPASRPLSTIGEITAPETADYERLRDALVTLALQSITDDDLAADERRRRLTRCLVDRAAALPRTSWSTALCVVGRRLPGVRGVAVTTYDVSGVPHPFAACDDWSRRAEEILQLVGEGPGLTAHLTRRPVLISRLDTEYERWPGYVAAATGTQVDALWSFPIPLSGSSLGSLTLYRDTRRGVTLWQDACTLSVLAASTLLMDLEEGDYALTDQSDAYGVVDIAAGVLSVQLSVSVEQALARIRAHAFGTGSRIADIGQAILDHRLDLS